MNEKMDKESVNALISYRLERSAETMMEAEILLREEHFNATINRLYYACYYAVSALLLQNQIVTQTHNGVKTMLGLHFVASGKLPIITAATYNTLFEKRQSGDYDDFIFFDKDMTQSLFEKANEFILEIKKLIDL